MKLTLKVFLLLLASVFVASLLGLVLAVVIIDLQSDIPRKLFHFFNPLTIIAGVSVFSILINSLILKRIKKLSSVMREVSEGNYSVNIPIKGRDELSALASEFNSMTNELKANEYLNKEYVKNISHELKTPLSSIKGYAEIMAEGDINAEKVKKYSRIIANEAERILSLSTQMLMLSKLESSNIIKKDEVFRADEQIREIILFMQNEWQSKGIEFEVDMEQVQVTGNQELTRQIWHNLISNAIKFTDRNGKIEVKLYKKERIYFAIKDNGIGISDDDKPFIFQQFFTADKSKESKNSGLGLSIVRRITEKLGGSIRFESGIGEGSVFYIDLPG